MQTSTCNYFFLQYRSRIILTNGNIEMQMNLTRRMLQGKVKKKQLSAMDKKRTLMLIERYLVSFVYYLTQVQ